MARQQHRGKNPSQVDWAERSHFMEAIRAAGEFDDTPALIYADFLEEQGEPERANFIRLQVEAARSWSDSAERRRTVRRTIQELLETHAGLWRERELPLIRGLNWNHYERGLVRTITVRRLQIVVEYADTIFNAAPIDGVCLRDPPSDAFISNTLLNQTPADQLAWIEHPVWDWIQRFDFKGCELRGRLLVFVERARWPKARTLNLSGCRLEDEDLQGMAFGRWEPLTRVIRLNLNHNTFSDEGLIALAESLAHGTEMLPLEELFLAGHCESVWRPSEVPEEPPPSPSLFERLRERLSFRGSRPQETRPPRGRFHLEARGRLTKQVIPALVKLANAAPKLRTIDLSDHPALVEPEVVQPLRDGGIRVSIGMQR